MQFKSTSVVLASAIAGLCASITSAAPIVIKTSQGVGADAEIRESLPEDARGTSGPTELAARSSSGNHTGFLLRFDLAGLTVADIGGFADLKLTLRGNGNGNGNANGLRIYGLNSGAALANTWTEAAVHYRDAGTVFPSTAGTNAQSQPAAGNPSLNGPTGLTVAPVAPFGASATYGSNPADSTRAPGILHEDSPYSANVASLNSTTYTNNLAVAAARDADLADDGTVQGTYAYTNYINQPSYTTNAFSGTSSDAINKPFSTYNSDIDASVTTFLGFLDYDAKTRAAGAVYSFSTTDENSPINHGAGDAAANRAALVAYLTTLLNAGETTASFMVFEKLSSIGNVVDAIDPLPARGDNLIFASKEFQPTGGAIGDWAPQLVLAPEPTSLSALALGSLILGRRRKA